VLPTFGFQVENCSTVIPYCPAIVSQPWPVWTKWNASQLATIPGWIGCGVSVPVTGGAVVVGDPVVVDDVVVVGGTLKSSTQYEKPTLTLLQSALTDGFYQLGRLVSHVACSLTTSESSHRGGLLTHRRKSAKAMKFASSISWQGVAWFWSHHQEHDEGVFGSKGKFGVGPRRLSEIVPAAAQAARANRTRPLERDIMTSLDD
jgi:hypothetical protein